MRVNRTTFFKAGTDNAAGADIDIGESPGKIDLGERDPPFATKRSTPAEGQVISGNIFLMRCSRSSCRSRKVLLMKTRSSFDAFIRYES